MCSGEELEWECKLALHVRVCVSLSLLSRVATLGCVCVCSTPPPTSCVFAGHVCYVTNEEERKRTRGPHLSCVGVWPMSDACHMTSMPHALASGLARSSLTLWGLSYILLCGGNSIDLRYTPPAFFGDTVTTRSDLFRSGDHLISATRLLLSLVTPSPQGDLFRSGDQRLLFL